MKLFVVSKIFTPVPVLENSAVMVKSSILKLNNSIIEASHNQIRSGCRCVLILVSDTTKQVVFKLSISKAPFYSQNLFCFKLLCDSSTCFQIDDEFQYKIIFTNNHG